MKAGQAIFTAECTHAFHLRCVAINIKHGHEACPVCRAEWKEKPFQAPPSSSFSSSSLIAAVRSRIRPLNPAASGRRDLRSVSGGGGPPEPPEPAIFDDDEPLDPPEPRPRVCSGEVELVAHPEFPAVAQSDSEDNFTVLVHVRAPPVFSGGFSAVAALSRRRAAVDLVTVLDISGSMAGTKLALMKRAMGFVIENLSPSDRLSVVTFSSTARRVFSLRRMSLAGRQQALLAVDSLVSGGGTDIGAGLLKAAKLIGERREKNPVSGVIILSDGKDNYDFRCHPVGAARLLTGPFCRRKVPIYTFGFGADHDPAALHSISEISGGTFSFVESEPAIQGAFAQCVAGILSVAAQDIRLELESSIAGVRLNSITAGRYPSSLAAGGLAGAVEVGDLYAEECRDFLASVTLPPAIDGDTPLLKLRATYRDPITGESVAVEGAEVRIDRPRFLAGRTLSMAVDRQRNRVLAAAAMEGAMSAANRGELSEAVSVLEECRKRVKESASGIAGDGMCSALDAEMAEMQARMASRRRYTESGMAYVLSGLSSHSRQRATARGDSTEVHTAVLSYQTQAMADMVRWSQVFPLEPPPSQPPAQKPLDGDDSSAV